MREILALAAGRHGVFTLREWRDAGLTERQLRSATAGGIVVPVHRGVFGIAGAPGSFERDVTAACAALDGVAAHACAAHLWRFRRFEAKPLEVLVARAHTPQLPGVLVRRTSRLERPDRTRLGPIPITTRSRTLLDLAGAAPGRVEGALNGVVLANPSELGRIDRMLRRAGPGRDGTALLRRLVDPMLGGRRPTESVLEDDLLAVLRAHGLPEPVPQFPVGDHRIDFAYPPGLLGLEAHGYVAHAEKADVQRNCTKSNALVDWRILYFTWDDVHDRPDYVAHTVAAALKHARPAVVEQVPYVRGTEPARLETPVGPSPSGGARRGGCHGSKR